MSEASKAVRVVTHGAGSGVLEVTGVVLAGGDSTRFADGDKMLATVDGLTILQRVVGTLHTATDRWPVIAVRTARQRATYERVLADEVTVVLDAPDRSGPVAGLAAAAAAAPTRWLFVAAGDMPLLSAAAVRWTLDQGEGATASVPVSADGTVQPLHAGYRRAPVREAIGELAVDASLRDLLDTLAPIRTLGVDDAPSDVPLAESITNVNTVDDLTGARDRFDKRRRSTPGRNGRSSAGSGADR